jgi:hypothetical protein
MAKKEPEAEDKKKEAEKTAKKKKKEPIDAVKEDKLVYEFIEVAGVVRIRCAPSIEIKTIGDMINLGYDFCCTRNSMLRQPLLYFKKNE